MRKTITTQQLKASIGEFMDAVRLRGDRYVITRRGKPLAAIVPVQTLEKEETDRRQFFELIGEIRAQNADKDPDEVDMLIAESIEEVRAEKRAKHPKGNARGRSR